MGVEQRKSRGGVYYKKSDIANSINGGLYV